MIESSPAEKQPGPSDVSDAFESLCKAGTPGNTSELSDLAYRVAAGHLTVEQAQTHLD